ncbi:MAG: tol-pal system protein YbgF [Hyphomicrobiaceae bacterium]|nr:tol-pal system protein YbgF [Hyphomicrobiaceae bacterium]
MPSNMLSHFTPVLTATAMAFVFAFTPAIAQTEQRSQQLPPVATPPAAKQPAAAAGQKAGTPAAAKPGSEAALQQRVDQLEEQLIDLQVVIGTLESLAKAPAGQATPAAADAQRIQALEAQLKSLSAQIEQLGEKVRGAGEPTKRSESAPPPQRPQATAAAPAPKGTDQPSTASFGSATVTSSRPDEPAPGAALPPIGANDAALPPIGANDAGPPPAANAAAPSTAPGDETAALPPSGDPGDSKHDYEVAYSYIIQRDYGAAQAGFTDFMKRYPKDALVPNALYWLGETHYQQRNFADAAEAFDLVTRLYSSSPKAADSQLKRALSFSALGKNNEACAALSDLDKKFQNAPTYVKTRAGSERHRLGCTG